MAEALFASIMSFAVSRRMPVAAPLCVAIDLAARRIGRVLQMPAAFSAAVFATPMWPSTRTKIAG